MIAQQLEMYFKIFERISIFWPLPQTKNPKLGRKTSFLYQVYKAVYRRIFSVCPALMFFCSIFVIFEISCKSNLIWGTTFAHASCMLQIISLQIHDVPAWEKSLLIQQIMLVDSKFQGKIQVF